MNISKEQAQWLLNEYQPRIGGSLTRKTMEIHMKAINILKGTDMGIPGCSCEWRANAQIAKSLFEQYQLEIEKLANEETEAPKAKRGRPKKS